MRVLMFIVQCVIAGLALAFVVTRLLPERFASAPAPAPPAATTVAVGPASYRDAVARAAPAVVNIYTTRVVADQAYRLFADPLTQRTYPVPFLRQRLGRGLGSGVIIRDDGYLLTNYHVIADAQDIYVGLYDGRVTRATVAGSDRDTDLAVLKLDGSGFPTASFAPPDGGLAVGDVVLAIGNPFGIGQTVTLGIVSATGRDQPNLSRYEDFIQTDATINSGNSGGALVNAAGELVGINTAQFGPGLGINFAIPATAARRVLDEILDHGYVIRGWMGADYATATTSAAAVRDGLPRGVQVVGIVPGGPADLAGLRPGDIILRFAGTEITDESELRNREASTRPGTTVDLAGERAGVPFALSVTLAERPRPSS
jgi:serine protease DegS/serine protease DegQ